MNIWTEKSIELANQRDYLDQLYKVYPMANNLKRELSEDTIVKLEQRFNDKDNKRLISLLLEQELFPVKDSYVAYLRRDKTALERNPNTVNRLSGMIYEMGLEEALINMTLPKETNRQIGPLFSNWLRNRSLGAPVTKRIKKFLEYEGNIILDASDAAMEIFARDYLGYNHNKGIDFIAKFNNNYVVGEAKFLTDFGGHQNAQLADALNVLRSNFKRTDYNVIPIAILDGVLYIPNKGKMHRQITNAPNNEIILSALMLRNFLYSL